MFIDLSTTAESETVYLPLMLAGLYWALVQGPLETTLRDDEATRRAAMWSPRTFVLGQIPVGRNRFK